MSGSFFEEPEIPEPHNNSECGGVLQAQKTVNIMEVFEKKLLAHSADVVLVVDDVTATMAFAIAQKLHTKDAHLEAEIRSGDWSMPEEINFL